VDAPALPAACVVVPHPGLLRARVRWDGIYIARYMAQPRPGAPVLGWTAAPMGYRHIDVRPLSGALGAEIGGVDLGQALAGDGFGDDLPAFRDRSVILC